MILLQVWLLSCISPRRVTAALENKLAPRWGVVIIVRGFKRLLGAFVQLRIALGVPIVIILMRAPL